MSNININYRSALILKHALKRQLLEKEKYIRENDVEEDYINDYKIEKRVYEDFSSKIKEKFRNRCLK